MRFDRWRTIHNLSRHQVARALGVSHNSLNRLGNGQPPTLRRAALLHHLSGGKIDWEEMLPTGYMREVAKRVERARRELGLD